MNHHGAEQDKGDVNTIHSFQEHFQFEIPDHFTTRDSSPIDATHAHLFPTQFLRLP